MRPTETEHIFSGLAGQLYHLTALLSIQYVGPMDLSCVPGDFPGRNVKSHKI